jgi:hypothetical protein
MKKLLLIIGLLFLIDSSGFACTCIPPKSPSKELEQSAAVFSGKVIEIRISEEETDIFAQVEAVLEVERAWKGVDKKTVSVLTSSHSSACGYGFKKGERYLVYAGGNRDEKLITSICSRTRRMNEAGDDLRELGEGKEIVAVMKSVHHQPGGHERLRPPSR